MARRHSDNRCDECSLFHKLCICPDLKPLDLSTKITFLMHVRENSLTTNTARLMHLLTKGSEIHYRGSPDGPLNWTPEKTEYFPLFLFPSEDARDLGEVATEIHQNQPDAKIHLIVPDGNWKQCAKTKKRSESLHSIQSVKIPEGRLSEFLLRTEPREECVSTFEAVARALGVLHGEAIEKHLMHFFHLKQDRILYARGLKKEELVYGGIPESGRKPWH